MVQKPTNDSRKRGRPPKFVRDEVLDAALRTFWEKGVDRVTLDDIEASAGVDRSTLYNSFDGKAGLYREVAARYVDGVTEHIFAPLVDVDDGLEAVAQTVERLRDANRDGAKPLGCLIVNDLATPSVDPLASERYLETMRTGVRSALARAGDDGSIDAASVDEVSDVVVGALLGANITGRASGPDAAIRSLDALASLVRGLRR